VTAAGPHIAPVYVVLPPRTLLLDIAGPMEVLRKANAVQDATLFDLHYVGPSPKILSSIGLTLSEIEPLPRSLPEGALVVLSGNVDVVMDADDGASRALMAGHGRDEALIVDWLRTTIRPGHKLVSICSGALLAGRAGLLDFHACTTHHECCAELALVAPRATVLENRLYVEDGERFTSAGITTGIDLMLHLVRRFIDPACVPAIARYLVVYLRRNGSDPQFSPWLEGRNHVHPAVHRVQDAITAEPRRDWTLEALAAIAAASPRHLSRLFNEHAEMSVSEYVNRLRVALAHELLGHTRLDMESVAERSGFGSTRQLRRAWGRIHPLPPRHARGNQRTRK
jgi:transcriptional regulator GlxA family with amidase domain